MNALRIHAAGDLRIHSEEVPQPDEGEALIRVGAVGICGSDLHWFEGAGIGDAKLTHPLILGHEFGGYDPATGKVFALDPAIPCGACRLCRNSNHHLCEKMQFAGHDRTDGALREWINWPKKNLFELPAGMSAVEGAMLEPLGVAIFALGLAEMQPGLRVGIFGCGTIGLLILQLALGSQPEFVVATDRLPHRLEAARNYGAHQILQVGPDGFPAEPERWKGDAGLDVVFEVAGDNAAVESAVMAARPGGRLVLVGIPGGDRTSFRASTARRKGLELRFCRRMKDTYPRAIELVRSGQIDVLSLVTHRFPLKRFEEAFQTAARREGIKVIIEP